MGKIKRILWIDDYPNGAVKSMFPECETKQVSTMDEAIEEIGGKHLYHYDTIVFDIDFENGLPKGEASVLKKLSEKLYLEEYQKNKDYIIKNGGYLLFLYLLERGYPSGQVAFLTGNTGIIKQLKKFADNEEAPKTPEEIAERIIKIWEDGGKDDLDVFEDKLLKLPIHTVYKDMCYEYDECLEDGDRDGVFELIRNAKIPMNDLDNPQNTGDMMIFRFHNANLKPPVYFAKSANDIAGHGIDEAKVWLKEKRTENNITRWLVLDIADGIEGLFRKEDKMNANVAYLFQNVSSNPGIRSAFRQMFFVFDGLRDYERNGIRYQAITAMLIPFDCAVKNSNPPQDVADMNYDKVRTMFARFSKQARNYCAHNYFGSTMENPTVLFVLAGTVAAVLSKENRVASDGWFASMYAAVSDGSGYDAANNIVKIDGLCQNLLNGNHIDLAKAFNNGVPSYQDYTPWDMLRVLGYNKSMNIKNQLSSAVREEYYKFTLAAYIVKWFEHVTEAEIEQKCGRGIVQIYRLAHEIVDSYNYPTII